MFLFRVNPCLYRITDYTKKPIILSLLLPLPFKLRLPTILFHDMIIVSGFNVFPNEIEEVVAMHEGVLEVAAIGIPHEVSGEQVKVFVVKKDQSLTEKDIIKHCRDNLTNYKVPKLVEFRDELPKTNVGKILRRALKDEQK